LNYRTRWIRTGTAAIAIALVVSVSTGRAYGQNHPSAPDALREGFANPPASARLRCYWWWLNGHTTAATITRDLEEMQKKGYGGVLLVDANGANQNGNDNVPTGPEFGSPEWTALYVHALKEADRLGLEVTLNITSGWNLGGPWVRPEQASKLLTWSRTTFRAGGGGAITLSLPPTKNGFYQQIAVLAYPLHHGTNLPGKDGDTRKPLSELALKSAAAEGNFSMPDMTRLLVDPSPESANEQDTDLSEVRDISNHVETDGTVHWAPPAGEQSWEILRIGYTSSDARVSTSSGAWQGLAIDYLDPAALDQYWNKSVLPLLTAAKPYIGRSLKYLASDSWELGGTNWTGNFRDEFRKRRGYDPVPYLPVMSGRIIGSRDLSTRFLADLRRTVADLVNGHYDHLAQLSSRFGLGIQCESGGPHGAPFDALETFPGLSHRSEWIADVGGVRYIDDSKGTNVGATMAAVAGMPGPLVMIAGGEGKGQDFTPLAQAFRGKVRHVVLIGKDAPAVAAALAGVCPTETVASMQQAVMLAARVARAGDAVLLSPACASFDMFRDYGHRGDVFAAAVHDLERRPA